MGQKVDHRAEGKGQTQGGRGKWTEKAAEKVAEEVTQRRQQREAAEGNWQG